LTSAAVTAALGAFVAGFTLAGPTHIRCRLPELQPGTVTTPTVQDCRYVSALQSGEPLWPLPLLPIVVWGLAPLVVLIGVILITRGGRGLSLVYLGLVLEATAVISVFSTLLFGLYVLVPVLITTLLARSAHRAVRATL
jgi:hypothetical protein